MKKTLKIIGALCIACIVAIGLTLFIGGRDAAELDIEGLVPKKHLVPEDQNAFSDLMNAADALVFPPDASILTVYINGEPVEEKIITDFLEKNAAAFKHMEKVLTFEHCQAPEGNTTSHLDKWYQIAIAVAVRSFRNRQAGRTGASVDNAIALMRLGNMIHSDAQYLADYTAGTKILQLGLEEVDFVIHLKEVDPEDLRRLVDIMTDLRPLDQGMVRAVKNKYQTVAKAIDAFRGKKVSLEQSFSDTYHLPYILRKTTWYPGYMFKENETKGKLARLYKDMAENVPKIYADMKFYDLEQYLGLMGSRFIFFLSPNFVGRVFYAFTTPEFQSFLEGKCRLEGTVRALRLMTAVKLYQKETGTLPDTLQALCPKYLSEVPLDPFDGKPFRYLRDKEVIYSVGKDLKDSKGSVTVPPDEIYGKDYPKTWIAEDAVFYLDRPGD